MNPTFLEVDGLRMCYERGGRGRPVLLLHGSGSSLEGVGAVAGRLVGGFDVIRPDLPGFGRTGPRPDRDYRVTTYAATVARLLDRLGVERCAVAGNSLGGAVAWHLALDRPDRVDALVLINATGYRGKTVPAPIRLARNPVLGPLLRRWTPRWATARGLRHAVGPGSAIVTAELVDRVHTLTARNRAAFVDLARTDQPDRAAEIPGITVPTLVLRSARLDGQHFARDIPGSRERVHPSTGHLLPEEDPDWVAAAIRDFLR